MANQKLLQPGWAGDLSSEELAFIKSKLKADRRLRARWGLGRGTGRLNDEMIRKVAMDGVQNIASKGLRCHVQLPVKNGRR